MVTAIALVAGAPMASAHTGFVSSTPADGSTVDQPVSEISLTFSGAAEPAGEGFVILDPTGTIQAPSAVTSPDNLTWTLRFEPPLTGGLVGVRWQVAAPDAHPIDGSFTFTVTAPAIEAADPIGAPQAGSDATAEPESASSPVVPTDSSESDAAPDLTDLRADEGPQPTSGEGAVAAAEPAAPAQQASEEAPAPPPEASDDPTIAAGSVAAPTEAASQADTITMDDFLQAEAPAATGVAVVSAMARAASLLGAVLAVGGLAFAALVLRGESSDIRAVLVWVRRAGALLALGSIVEAAAHVATLDGSWSGWLSPSAVSDALLSSFGIAVILRAVGGALIANGAMLHTLDAAEAPDPVIAVKQMATVGAGPSLRSSSMAGQPPNTTEPYRHQGDRAWHAGTSGAAFGGIALILGSFLLDGHTASEGPRLLHALVNLVHVAAGTTWAGGVVMLAFIIARRHRRGADLRALQLAVRFSVVATVGLVAAGVAGSVLTVVILNSFSDLWSTPWGRLLLLKVVIVCIAAVGGAYNHRVLIPELERTPSAEPLGHRFRTIVTIEAIALALVALVTAALIASSAV